MIAATTRKIYEKLLLRSLGVDEEDQGKLGAVFQNFLQSNLEEIWMSIFCLSRFFFPVRAPESGADGDYSPNREPRIEEDELQASDYDDPEQEEFHLQNEEPVFNQFADDL